MKSRQWNVVRVPGSPIMHPSCSAGKSIQQPLKQLGNVADASSGGIGVLVDHSIPVGTAVTISCPSVSDFAVDGTVKHLSRSSDRYRVGVEFANAAESQLPSAAA
jgi:PilZ domain-containing protein